MAFKPYRDGIGEEKSLSDAENEIDAIAIQCSDIVTDTLDFEYDGDSIGIKDVGTRFGFTDTGLDQFGRFLGVKAHFFKMLKPETRKAVFDDVLPDAHEIQKDSKVRVFDNNVRAVLGAQYTPISGKMLIRQLRASGFEEKSLSLRLFADYESTEIVGIGREKIAEIQGRNLFPGIILRNDDVGRESASIDCFLSSDSGWGIIFGTSHKTSFKYNHTKRIEDRVSEGIRLSVEKVVDWFANSGDIIRKLMDTEALEKERLLRVLKSTEIWDSECEALFTIAPLVDHETFSVWELIEVVSIYAASIDNRQRTYKLMGIAGEMLNAPKPFAKIWRE